MKQKTIFIDGLGLVEGHFSGVGHYILGILRGIDEILEDNKYAGVNTPAVVVIIPYDSVAKFKLFNFKHIAFKKFPLSFRVMSGLWYRGKLPPIDLWCGRGTYIFPRFVNMPLAFSESALVIFDLSFELYRQYSDEGNAQFLSKRVRQSVRSSRKVITISQSAQREITDFYNLKSSQVVVATPAADPALFYRRSKSEIERVKNKYGISGDYILALSNLEPRKNLDALVEIYCQLPKSVTNKTALLLVGVSGWKTEKLFQKIVKKVEEGYNIIRPSSYVLDKDKPAIISGAKMLVYPSHYEGFGMPPLEALACGVPVISADNSSLPEVVGSAGMLVASDNNEKLLEAIKSCMENIDHKTEVASKAGPEQALKFSWRRSAQVFLDVVQEIDK
ncbi:MAG TPA: glycosyltransferase family 1 protein [Candidatus Saccharimonadales bacterium]|nr:glycosyltransferase family 1 protein [Candidatus Saccharimonadales bacterium]